MAASVVVTVVVQIFHGHSWNMPVSYRGAPDPDPDPTSQDPVWIRIRGRIRPDPNFCICRFPTYNNTLNFRSLLRRNDGFIR